MEPFLPLGRTSVLIMIVSINNSPCPVCCKIVEYRAHGITDWHNEITTHLHPYLEVFRIRNQTTMASLSCLNSIGTGFSQTVLRVCNMKNQPLNNNF